MSSVGRLRSWLDSSAGIAIAMALMNLGTYGYTIVAARRLGPQSYGGFAAVRRRLIDADRRRIDNVFLYPFDLCAHALTRNRARNQDHLAADAADHVDLGSEPRRGHGLVRALPAVEGGEGAVEDGLAGIRQPRHAADEVHVDRPHDDDGALLLW